MRLRIWPGIPLLGARQPSTSSLRFIISWRSLSPQLHQSPAPHRYRRHAQIPPRHSQAARSRLVVQYIIAAEPAHVEGSVALDSPGPECYPSSNRIET